MGSISELLLGVAAADAAATDVAATVGDAEAAAAVITDGDGTLAGNIGTWLATGAVLVEPISRRCFGMVFVANVLLMAVPGAAL